eukprot:2763382-Pyramimonas_sp.AAC.1
MSVFEPASMFVKCDPRHGKYMACCVILAALPPPTVPAVPRETPTSEPGYSKKLSSIRGAANGRQYWHWLSSESAECSETALPDETVPHHPSLATQHSIRLVSQCVAWLRTRSSRPGGCTGALISV